MNEIYRIFPDWITVAADCGERKYRHYLENGKIVWDVAKDKKLPHYDHIEFASDNAAGILSYGADKSGKLKLFLHAIYPQLRLNPNNTYGSFFVNFETSYNLFAGDTCDEEKLLRVEIDEFGITLISKTKRLEISRSYVASKRSFAISEKIFIKNIYGKDLEIKVANLNGLRYSEKEKGHQNKVYRYGCKIILNDEERTAFTMPLKEKEDMTFYAVYFAEEKKKAYDPKTDFADRETYVKTMQECLNIITPDETVNKLCEMAKVRACESIFKTKNGYMHAPGGGHYYAAVFTNDQGEYIMPYFGYCGYELAKNCTENTFSLFERYMYNNFAVPASIIAAGDDYFMYGDRGDCEMLANGMCRYLLTLGDREKAEKCLRGLRFCCDFALSKKMEEGVIESDLDELEGRFKHGRANLSINSVAYDLFEMQSKLEKSLGDFERSEYYAKAAMDLKESIENYFGDEVEGYKVYRYCEDEERLRSWICYPLMFGIEDRSEECVKALFAKELFNGCGLFTRAGDEVYWDRSTVSAFRAACYVGQPDAAYTYLINFSKLRLLGEHVPYIIEAYPEGGQAHLAAENAMYLRIFTEGMLGLKPNSFDSFELKVNIPTEWNFLELKNLHILGIVVDVKVERNEKEKFKIIISNDLNKTLEVVSNQSIVINIENQN